MNIENVIKIIIDKINQEYIESSKDANFEFQPMPYKSFDFLDKYNNDYSNFNFIIFCNYCIFIDLEFIISRKFHGSWLDEHLNSVPAGEFIRDQYRQLHYLVKAFLDLQKSNQLKAALIIFRSYLECSTTFFACLIDLDIFFLYSKDPINLEEAKMLFYKRRPDKILSKLKIIDGRYKKEIRWGRIGKKHEVEKQFIQSFIGNNPSILYEKLSQITHGNKSAIGYSELELEALLSVCSQFLIESHFAIAIATKYFYNSNLYHAIKMTVLLELIQEVRNN